MSKKLKGRIVKRRLPFYADAKAVVETDVKDLSFWQILGMVYPLSRDDLAKGMVGETMMPIEALLHGAPPAANSINVEMVLWQSSFDGRHPGHIVSVGRYIGDLAHHPEIDHVDVVRQSLDAGMTEDGLRCDYWSAMFGDLKAVERLKIAYANGPGLITHFIDALEEHCRTSNNRGTVSVYRPGLGHHLLVRGAQRSIPRLMNTLSDLQNLDAWGKARREETNDAAEEAALQHRDFVSQWAVDAAENYLTDLREDRAFVAAKITERKEAQVQGAAFAKGLFEAWRSRFFAGETIDAEEARDAAEEVVVLWQKMGDAHVIVDLTDDAEVQRVLEAEIDRLAIEKIRDEQKEKVEVLAKLGLKERSRQAAKAEIPGMGPIESMIAAGAFPTSIEHEDPDAQQAAELDAAIAEAEEKRTALMVLPHIDVTGFKSDTGDILHQAAKFGGIYIEQHLALYISDARSDLVAAWPHALDVIDRLLSDLTEGQPVAFRPTILIGAPGSGKTSLLREIAETLEHPHLVYGCAGVCDSSFAGTSAQWGSKRFSIPLELIRQTGRSNPLVILDELEKTGAYGNGGRLHDALLPLLERHSAEAFFEVGIERKANMSAVSYLATANSLEGIPAPLKDRFRVIQMPDAGPQHIGDLAKGILNRIIVDRGLDRSWTPPLQPDEVDIIRKSWSGGSLRRLRRAVEATLDARESVLRKSVM